MITISTQAMALCTDMSLIHVYGDNGEILPLSDEERSTLRLLPDIIIRVTDKAVPLQIRLMGGNPKSLTISPAVGGAIDIVEELRVQEGMLTLSIHPGPKE